MMSLFDSIFTSSLFQGKQATIYYIAAEGDLSFDSEQNANWDISTKTTIVTTAIEDYGQGPQFTLKKEKLGVAGQDDKVLLLPGNLNYNDFVHQGMPDRILFDGRWFEVVWIDDTEFFGTKQIAVFCKHLFKDTTL